MTTTWGDKLVNAFNTVSFGALACIAAIATYNSCGSFVDLTPMLGPAFAGAAAAVLTTATAATTYFFGQGALQQARLALGK